MNPFVIEAWARDVYFSHINDAGLLPLSPTPSISSPKQRASIRRSLSPKSSTRRKRVRTALDSIDLNRIDMPATRSGSPTKKPRTARTPSPKKTDRDETPRAVRSTARSLTVLPYAQALSAELATTRDTENALTLRDPETLSSSTGASTRSRSPVKCVASLHQVGGGIFYSNVTDSGDELGEIGQQLLWDLSDTSKSANTIPKRLWDSDQTFREDVGRHRLPAFFFDRDDKREIDDLKREYASIKEINEASRRCEEECEPEAEWNSAVHGFLLRLIFDHEKDDGVGYRSMVSDKINPRWLPPHSSGLSSSSRMIDYGIFLSGQTTDSPREHLQRRVANRPELVTPSINHTNRLGLRTKPIAISIETKTMSRPEEEARVQLAIWIASQIERIKALFPNDKPDKTSLSRIVFPLLYVHHSQWVVMFARLDPNDLNRLNIYVGPRLGDTATLQETYCLVHGLRRLKEFVAASYCDWWHDVLDELCC
ncbi:hypothetical protein FALBO_2982 [Fusarium albosuccineum]|uniref:PD-(D/E)XK nuclease-like domain-containing protein n=1 Tax=Fusarium albosuccineum TaxID=1237068 RepID=A0A8H4PLA4_9HYPO|nr:hypothetical protein FALBO_2982 [Fusarium albosuccineum]